MFFRNTFKSHSLVSKSLLGFAFVLVSSSCGKVQTNITNASDVSEVGQQIGDVMASIDESGGNTGNYGFLQSHERLFARYGDAPARFRLSEFLGIPSSFAATCSGAATFGSCSGGNVLTRTFSGCTIGAATFTGTVSLTYNAAGATCQIPAVGNSVTRVPNYTVTGMRGASLAVSKFGTVGQRITRTANAPSPAFSFTNDGIRRVFTLPNGNVILDFLTETTSALTITGSARAGRVLSGGTLRVTNRLSGTRCDYSPTNVTWGAGCVCATSGSWSGSCSDGKTSSLTLTGCGTADFTIAGTSGSVTFDRCY